MNPKEILNLYSLPKDILVKIICDREKLKRTVFVVEMNYVIMPIVFSSKEKAKESIAKKFRKRFESEMKYYDKLTVEEWKKGANDPTHNIKQYTHNKYIWWKTLNPTKLEDLQRFYNEMKDELAISRPFNYIIYSSDLQ